MPFINPYRDSGNWYKGNLHCHTNYSDGVWPPAQAISWYREQGYHFLAITDHRTLVEVAQDSSPDFLLLNGCELDATDVGHLVGIGMTAPVESPGSFQRLVDDLRAQGALAIIAHPYWTGNQPEQIGRIQGHNGIEVYNHLCQEALGKGYATWHWDELLTRGDQVWGFAADDSHFGPVELDRINFPAGGGWIMVNSPQLTRESILQSIEAGNFYSSRGPEIYSITTDGDTISVTCSPVCAIRFIGNGPFGAALHAPSVDSLLTQAEYQPAEHAKYTRIEIVDLEGKSAWSNPLMRRS